MDSASSAVGAHPREEAGAPSDHSADVEESSTSVRLQKLEDAREFQGQLLFRLERDQKGTMEIMKAMLGNFSQSIGVQPPLQPPGLQDAQEIHEAADPFQDLGLKY